MPYEILANLVEINALEIAQKAAQQVLAQKLSLYSQLSEATLASSFLTSIKMIESYLRTDDASEWRAYIYSVSLKWRSQGYSATEINAAGMGIITQIQAMVERELADSDDLSRYIRRIQGLATLANLSAFNAHLSMDKGSTIFREK
jgi:hypothetical protein